MFTKQQEESVKNVMNQEPPKSWHPNNYKFSIQGCPGYVGYIPENLSHKVCKYCGQINYYH